jgi:hypothetical protein
VSRRFSAEIDAEVRHALCTAREVLPMTRADIEEMLHNLAANARLLGQRAADARGGGAYGDGERSLAGDQRARRGSERAEGSERTEAAITAGVTHLHGDAEGEP